LFLLSPRHNVCLELLKLGDAAFIVVQLSLEMIEVALASQALNDKLLAINLILFVLQVLLKGLYLCLNLL
jgi:hypothetical protein